MEAKVTSVFGSRTVPLAEALESAVLRECLSRGAVYACAGSTSLGAYTEVGGKPAGVGTLVRMDSHWLIGACSMVKDSDTNFVAIVEDGRFVQADRIFQEGWRLQGWWPELGEVA